jgi:hypothetical protein
MQGWYLHGERQPRDSSYPPLEQFRRQQLDLYVPAGDVGNWQGAIRDADDPLRPNIERGLASGDNLLMLDLLYGDTEGGQGTVSRFSLTKDDDEPNWRCGVVRHWSLEGVDPRHLPMVEANEPPPTSGRR